MKKNSEMNKTQQPNAGKAGNAMMSSRVQNDPRNRMAAPTNKGGVGPGGMKRTMGASTKDAAHGVHTDHSTSRRSESRRDGSMGRESKAKSNRKNV